jgi:hypothetical protein
MNTTSYTLQGDDLRTVDHPLPLFVRASVIVEQYFSNIRGAYEGEELALAKTMFGFTKATGEYIEICVHSDTDISFRFAVPRTKRLLWVIPISASDSAEFTVTSQNETAELVRAFLRMKTEEYEDRINKHAA